VSYVSDDIFEFGGVVDMTGCSSGQQRSSAVDDEVFMSFPVGWTSGMKDVYMALVCRSSGHGVGVQELAGWVDLPEEGVRECLRGVQIREFGGPQAVPGGAKPDSYKKCLRLR
ncbi:hypothetical protein KXX35_003410, partial [Aspergillus fumigatus]